METIPKSSPVSFPDDRTRIRSVVNNIILHLHPAKVPAPALRFSYTWGLGGVSVLLAVMLIATGVLLMFHYEASTDRAYASIQTLETEVPFGSLVRAVHHWSANLLIVTVFLHLLRVLFTGSYKQGRTSNWLIGVGLLLLVVAFNFTGYLLPWDQLAYWAITVSTSLIGYLPGIGDEISHFILAGPVIGQAALRNFYAIHVAVLPALLVITMSYHFWKVRKNGGISQPIRSRAAETVTTIPHLIRREITAAAVVFAGVVLWSMWVAAPLEALANPSHSPNPAKAAWYFLGLQELLLHMHPLAAITLTTTVLAGLALLPLWDRRPDDIGVYFRSRRGRLAALLGALTSLYMAPLLVVADEFWLDLPALFAGWPDWVGTGLAPLALSLGGLLALYAALRKGLRANHSEALLGLATFLFGSLVLLTAIGIFFRGPNMALVLPF